MQVVSSRCPLHLHLLSLNVPQGAGVGTLAMYTRVYNTSDTATATVNASKKEKKWNNTFSVDGTFTDNMKEKWTFFKCHHISWKSYSFLDTKFKQVSLIFHSWLIKPTGASSQILLNHIHHWTLKRIKLRLCFLKTHTDKSSAVPLISSTWFKCGEKT